MVKFIVELFKGTKIEEKKLTSGNDGGEPAIIITITKNGLIALLSILCLLSFTLLGVTSEQNKIFNSLEEVEEINFK